MNDTRRPNKSDDEHCKNKSSDSGDKVGSEILAEQAMKNSDSDKHCNEKSNDQAVKVVIDKKVLQSDATDECLDPIDQVLSKESGSAVCKEVKTSKDCDEHKNSSASASKGASSEGASKQPQKTVSKKPAQKKGKGLAIFAVLLSLASAGGVAYVVWQTMQFKEVLTAQDAVIADQKRELPQQVSNLNAKVSQLTGDISVLDERSQQATEQSESTASRFQLLVERVNEMNTQDRTVWLTAEAEYLMRLANQRLLMAKDVGSATALLRQAQRLLVEVDEYGLFQVRKILTDDIAALNAVTKPEIESLWLQLNTIGQRVYNLPIISTKKEFNPLAVVTEDILQKNFEQASEEQLTSYENWQQKIFNSLRAVWSNFSSQFRVRSDRTDFNPELLVPGEEQNLRHHLHLMTEQAQLALQREQPEIYRASLENVLLWVDRWFINKDSEAEAIVAQIKELRDIDVTVKLPDISGSLKALQSYRKRHALDRLSAPEKGASQLQKNTVPISALSYRAVNLFGENSTAVVNFEGVQKVVEIVV